MTSEVASGSENCNRVAGEVFRLWRKVKFVLCTSEVAFGSERKAPSGRLAFGDISLFAGGEKYHSSHSEEYHVAFGGEVCAMHK